MNRTQRFKLVLAGLLGMAVPAAAFQAGIARKAGPVDEKDRGHTGGMQTLINDIGSRPGWTSLAAKDSGSMTATVTAKIEAMKATAMKAWTRRAYAKSFAFLLPAPAAFG